MAKFKDTPPHREGGFVTEALLKTGAWRPPKKKLFALDLSRSNGEKVAPAEEDSECDLSETITKSSFARRFGINRQAVDYLIEKGIVASVMVERPVPEIPKSEIVKYKKRKVEEFRRDGKIK